MIIGEIVVNHRDVLNAWYRFEPGACAYCFTLRMYGDNGEGYSDREQWTPKKDDIEKYMKLANKCIEEGNVWRDEMAKLESEQGDCE